MMRPLDIDKRAVQDSSVRAKNACQPAALLALGLIDPHASWGQEWTVTARGHAFIARSLQIGVQAEAPGVLHVARGSHGEVRVTARALHGVAESGLTGRADNRLVLTGVGDSLEFIVLVPEGTRTTIVVPGRPFLQVAGMSGRFTYRTYPRASRPSS